MLTVEISKLPTQEENESSNALSANDKQALMLYRIMTMQRQQEMQKTMQKQRTIAYEVNAKIQKMDETQKCDRLDEISSHTRSLGENVQDGTSGSDSISTQHARREVQVDG